MANKRALKKRIQQVCGEAAVEVLMNLPEDLARKTVIKLASLQSHSLANVTFGFDRSHADFESGKEYNKARNKYTRAAYAKLHTDFTAELNKIVAEINAALTAEQREANKAAVNG